MLADIMRWIRGEDEYGTFAGTKLENVYPAIVLPVGWKHEAPQEDEISGDVWYLILDDRDRVRIHVQIRTHLHSKGYILTLSYSTRYQPNFIKEEDGRFFNIVEDQSTNTVVWKRQAFLGKSKRNESLEWLNQNYPDWENPHAYWDD